MKQLSGTIHTYVSTRVEVVLTERNLGNIIVKQCYNISFLFSLRYKDHETNSVHPRLPTSFPIP